jgi:hypothetical protein
MYSTWPFTCPRSWTRNPKVSIVRSSVEDGYPKVRRRFTKGWDEYQVEWVLEWDQEQALIDFFTVDCQDGSTPFYLNDPYTGGQLIVRWKEPPVVRGNVDSKPTLQVTATLERVFS